MSSEPAEGAVVSCDVIGVITVSSTEGKRYCSIAGAESSGEALGALGRVSRAEAED